MSWDGRGPGRGGGALTPYAAGEGDEHAERFCVVFCALVRLEAFEDPDHDREDDDLAGGADGERDVGDPVSLHGLIVRVLFWAGTQSNKWAALDCGRVLTFSFQRQPEPQIPVPPAGPGQDLEMPLSRR